VAFQVNSLGQVDHSQPHSFQVDSCQADASLYSEDSRQVLRLPSHSFSFSFHLNLVSLACLLRRLHFSFDSIVKAEDFIDKDNLVRVLVGPIRKIS